MDMQEYARRVMQGKDGAALDALTQSETGARLAAKFDGAALEAAARSGDMQTLSKLMKQILDTPEGRRFAAEVQKTVGRDGR